jgi:hypothetical protein
MNGRNSPDRGRPDESGDEIQWICVATAPDQLVAEMWQEVLRDESIPSMLAPQDAISFLGLTSTPVRLMVPEAMRARAEDALAGLQGDAGEPEGS